MLLIVPDVDRQYGVHGNRNAGRIQDRHGSCAQNPILRIAGSTTRFHLCRSCTKKCFNRGPFPAARAVWLQPYAGRRGHSRPKVAPQPIFDADREAKPPQIRPFRKTIVRCGYPPGRRRRAANPRFPPSERDQRIEERTRSEPVREVCADARVGRMPLSVVPTNVNESPESPESANPPGSESGPEASPGSGSRTVSQPRRWPRRQRQRRRARARGQADHPRIALGGLRHPRVADHDQRARRRAPLGPSAGRASGSRYSSTLSCFPASPGSRNTSSKSPR